jgi:hypothetical protein
MQVVTISSHPTALPGLLNDCVAAAPDGLIAFSFTVIANPK